MTIPDLNTIREAAERIRPYIHRTAVLSSQAINEMLQAEILFKCENFQKAGAFKSRGATNAVFSLAPRTASRGVATHSSGNHASCLSYAARLRGVPCNVVMPRTAPQADARSRTKRLRRAADRPHLLSLTSSNSASTTSSAPADEPATATDPVEAATPAGNAEPPVSVRPAAG